MWKSPHEAREAVEILLLCSRKFLATSPFQRDSSKIDNGTMNKNKRFLWPFLFLGVLLATLTPAWADGPISPPAPKGAALLNWTGFYLGGNVGANWGDYHFGESSLDVRVPTPNTLFSDKVGPNAPSAVVTIPVDAFSEKTGGEFIGGGQIGYNYQFGSFVIGFEGDFDGTTLSAEKSFDVQSTDPILGNVTLSAMRSASTSWMTSGRARFGFAWNRFLFYGTGGVAVTELSVDGTNTFTPGAFTQSASDQAVVVGWTGGGGAEFAVSDAVSVGVEYRRSDFGSESFDLTGNSRFSTTHPLSVDLIEDQVTFRVNIRFDSLFHR